MQNKPKIGIMTFYAAQNNGAALQAFALQQNLKILGADAEFIRFYDRHNEKEVQRHSRLYNFFHKSQVLKNVLFHFGRTLKLRGKSMLTDQEYKSFCLDYFNTSVEPYYEYEDLYKANAIYNGFVTGSDMVWTPIGQNLPAYFLQFAEKGKRFSYAPSMTGMSSYTIKQHKEIQKYLKDFDLISCREVEGVNYLKEQLNLSATQTLDPTLLFTKEDWCRELGITIDKSSKPYILCYLFDELTKVQKKSLFEYAKNNGWEVRFIPMSMKQREHEIDHGYVQGYGPRTFVEMFMNAGFVITNTYHGLMFSLLSENPFVLVHRGKDNKWRSNEGRMSHILDLIGQADRYLYSDQEIPNDLFQCDYTSILPILHNERYKSLSYLKECVDQISTITIAENKMKYASIQELSQKECTGCGLCVQKCSFGAISMNMNTEGFMIPVINHDKCRQCGKCIKICPSLNPVTQNYPIEVKGCLSKDVALEGSASGGAFVSIARYFIEVLHGYVYGAVFDDNFNCIHTEASNMTDVQKMQNSKYVQSSIVDVLPQIKQRLSEASYVLFTGTPCQVASVLAYVGSKDERLTTVSLICHGVPSPGFWKIYLANSFGEKISHYSFRDRNNRYQGKSSFQGKSSKISTKVFSPFKDVYYRTFLRGVSFRESCYYCLYARNERVGDLTIGDFDSEKLYPDFYPNDSKSVILINNMRGKEIWNEISSRFNWIDINYQEEAKKNSQLRIPNERPSLRNVLYKDLASLPWKSFVKQYTKC